MVMLVRMGRFGRNFGFYELSFLKFVYKKGRLNLIFVLFVFINLFCIYVILGNIIYLKMISIYYLLFLLEF